MLTGNAALGLAFPRAVQDNSNGEQGAAPSIKTGSVSHQSVAGYGNQEPQLSNCRFSCVTGQSLTQQPACSSGKDMTQADFLVRWLNGSSAAEVSVPSFLASAFHSGNILKNQLDHFPQARRPDLSLFLSSYKREPTSTGPVAVV